MASINSLLKCNGKDRVRLTLIDREVISVLALHCAVCLLHTSLFVRVRPCLVILRFCTTLA